MWYTQDYRDRPASFRVGGLKKNAWRKIFLLNYFLFNLFLFLQKSGGGGGLKPLQPLPLRGPWTRLKFFHILCEF